MPKKMKLAGASAVDQRYNRQLRLLLHEERGTDDITYSHMAMCQVYLPYTRYGEDVYEVKQGKLIMRVQAAKYIDQVTGERCSRGIPYGTRARLLIYLMNEMAIEQQRPDFCISKNFSDLTRKLRIGRTGREMQDLKEQFERLCTASFSLEWELAGAQGLHNFFLIDSVITPRPLKGMDYATVEQARSGFWIHLSEKYFNSLLTKAVPLDKRAIVALQNNPMCLDIYNWLTQRLHRIEPDRPQFVTWLNLYEQFGRGYAHMFHFKTKFRANLQDVRLQYREAKLEEIPNRGLRLYASPPPVAPRTQLVF
jgi:hypothetical protein